MTSEMIVTRDAAAHRPQSIQFARTCEFQRSGFTGRLPRVIIQWNVKSGRDEDRMKLPHHESVEIPEQKIAEYLLSSTHRDGRHKAAFFSSFGFSTERWEVLAEALREHAANHEVAKVEDSPFGTRYIVEGVLTTPDGRNPLVRSVWFIDAGETTPRLVTAYPLKRGHDA